MTKKQQQQFLSMHAALQKIAKDYQTPEQLHRISEKGYGLDYEESLAMAYDNIQAEARHAVKGIRIKSVAKTLSASKPQHNG